MGEKTIYAGERYRHYKGGLYQIVAVAMHTETEEDMVIYQALYGDYKVYARPLNMFFENVSDDKGKIVLRFIRENEKIDVRAKKEVFDVSEKQEITHTETYETESMPEGVNPLLISFLDAESCNEKLEVLRSMRKNIDDKTISDIAAAMDIVIEEKSVEERLKDLESCLVTRARFETTRLR